MRKISLLTVATLYFSVFANAQITKGSIFLGGSISYLNTTERKSFGISGSLSNPSNITVGVRFIIPKK